MKHYRTCLSIAVLVAASIACQAVTGAGSDEAPVVPSSTDSAPQPEVEQPTAVFDDGNDNGSSDSSVSTDFPMTDDAFNVVEAGGSLIYYTNLSADDALEFYRDEYTSMGYTERDLLTVAENGMFSIVFDGDPSGKAVIIQSVDLGDGSRTIAIRLEDI
jgi:hypothetical protein